MEVSSLKEEDELIQKFRENAQVPLIGEDPSFRRALLEAAKFAQSAGDPPVLLTGETGTGKELFAKAIHKNSNRAGKTFLPVNCSAIPDSLFESTVFGHTKGAFTGADRDRSGFFETVGDGTLFLDEIGDMTLEAQIKMLRVLDSQGQFMPVGSDVIRTTRARIIAATNQYFAEVIAAKSFRQDLYYRLATLTINLPPLRDRAEDIPLLIGYFTEQFNRRLVFSGQAMGMLYHHNWPGNVRELQNLIIRLMALHLEEDDEVEPNELILSVSPAPAGSLPAVSLQDMIDNMAELLVATRHMALETIDRMLAAAVLKLCGNNKTKAAEILMVSTRTLRNWFHTQ